MFRSIGAKIDALQVKNLHSKPSEDKRTQVLGAECADNTENNACYITVYLLMCSI